MVALFLRIFAVWDESQKCRRWLRNFLVEFSGHIHARAVVECRFLYVILILNFLIDHATGPEYVRQGAPALLPESRQQPGLSSD